MLALACGGKDGGTPPTPPSDSSSTMLAPIPTITGVDDTVLTIGVQTQLSVVGSAFTSDMALEIISPNASPQRLTGAQLLGLSATAVNVVVSLDALGAWSIQAVTTDGRRSNARTVTVIAKTVPPTPALVSVQPTSALSDSGTTSLRVVSRALALPVQLVVTKPNGTTLTPSAFSISVASDSGFTLSAIFADVGTWLLRLASDSTAIASHSLPFMVQPRPPLITSVTPPRVSLQAVRDFSLVGTGIQNGATVQIFAPGSTAPTPPYALRGQDASSIAFSAYLSAAGFWGVRVVNPDGGVSATTTVESVVPPKIFVTLAPGWVTAPTSNQLTFLGRGFETGLTVTGFGSTLVSALIFNMTPTSVAFDASHLLGLSNLSLTNAATTGAFTNFGLGFGPGHVPTVTLMTPQAVVASTTPQTITVSGCCNLDNAGVVFQQPAGFGTTDPVSPTIISATSVSITFQLPLPTVGTWQMYVTLGGLAEKPIPIFVKAP